MRHQLVAAHMLSVLAAASNVGSDEWWSNVAQSWSLPLAREWSAEVAFQKPGNTDWVNSTMSWWSTEDDQGMGPAFKFRFNRHSPRSWITSDYTQDFDELLEYRRGTETGDGKVGFMAIAVGAQCNRGNYEFDLFSDMEVVDGKEEWRDRCKTVLASRHPGKGNMTFCLGSGGVPKSLDIVLDPAFSGKTNADFFTVSVAFHNVKLGPLPGNTFARPAPCLEGPPPAACPYAASKQSEEKTMIHFTHAAGMSCGLNNLMTNDVHGSLAYSTGTSGSWIFAASPYYEYMQVYNVTMRRGFAPLEDCNYIVDQKQMVCRGGFRTAANAKNVGRSSVAYMEGPFSGQCAENALVGSWFSFPSAGECAAGWDVGFQNCSWKTQAFKVVSTSCVSAYCAETARDALKTGGSIIHKSVLDCVNNAIALCPDHKGAMGPTCFSRPAADIHV